MEKYSDKFINQIHKLKNAIIGMEFEFYTNDISFYKTLEILNQYLAPVKVWGFRKYHSDFTPDQNNFKIEPDISGGSYLVELVTGPLDYFNAKHYLIKISKWIQENGYTNDKSSIHFNISFNDEDKNLNDLNVLKLILNTDEDEIWNCYPSRKNNVYANSVKKIIPYKEYNFFNIQIEVIKNNMRLPNNKYYGINFTNITNDKKTQRLEYRYIGGKNYEKNIGQLIYFMEKFIINSWDSIDTGFNNEDVEILSDYLEDNIKSYNNISKYKNFIIENPTIHLQIDQNSNYDIVETYYYSIWKDLYNILDSTIDLKECIINYVTQTKLFEIVDANVKLSSSVSNLDFINCTLEGIFENCFFVGCDIKNSQMKHCKLQHSDALKSKLLGCKVEQSNITECYFVEGLLNGDMIGGVFRSGELGPYASMDSNVKIVKDNGNFFDTKYDDEDGKGDKEGKIFGFGKDLDK